MVKGGGHRLAALVIGAALLAVTGSAHGRGVIYFAGLGAGNWDIWAVDPEGGEPRRVTTTVADERRPAVTGHQLVLVNGERRLEVWDLATGTRSRLPAPPAGYADQPAWLDNDTLIFARYQVLPTDHSDLWLQRRQKDAWQLPVPLVGGRRSRHFPAVAPAGERIAYTLAWRQDGTLTEEIAVCQRDGKNERQLTTHGGNAIRPAWSPAGDQLLYCADRGGDYDIWLLDLASGAQRQLTRQPGYDCEPSWSPAGDGFVFVSSRGGGRQLWLQDLAGGAPRRLTTMPAMDPVWIDRDH